ncbi:hypothetical protein RUND412_010361 [Rhizina undulata]
MRCDQHKIDIEIFLLSKDGIVPEYDIRANGSEYTCAVQVEYDQPSQVVLAVKPILDFAEPFRTVSIIFDSMNVQDNFIINLRDFRICLGRLPGRRADRENIQIMHYQPLMDWDNVSLQFPENTEDRYIEITYLKAETTLVDAPPQPGTGIDIVSFGDEQEMVHSIANPKAEVLCKFRFEYGIKEVIRTRYPDFQPITPEPVDVKYIQLLDKEPLPPYTWNGWKLNRQKNNDGVNSITGIKMDLKMDTLSQLPFDWAVRTTLFGTPYFANQSTGGTTFLHPNFVLNKPEKVKFQNKDNLFRSTPSDEKQSRMSMYNRYCRWKKKLQEVLHQYSYKCSRIHDYDHQRKAMAKEMETAPKGTELTHFQQSKAKYLEVYGRLVSKDIENLRKALLSLIVTGRHIKEEFAALAPLAPLVRSERARDGFRHSRGWA